MDSNHWAKAWFVYKEKYSFKLLSKDLLASFSKTRLLILGPSILKERLVKTEIETPLGQEHDRRKANLVFEVTLFS